MLYRPVDNLQNNDFTENLQNSSLDEHRQHGIHQNQQPQQQYLSRDGHDKDTLPAGQERKRSILLDVPPETLTSITSYLTPPALLSLECVSSYLAHHVKEDNTWRRAFVCHFLGISPEADINIGNRSASEGVNSIPTGYDLPSVNPWKTLLLRRVEGKSWRDEFAWRYVMINRWNRSKSATITHIPIIHSTISSLHLMNIPSPAHSSTTATTSSSGAGANTTAPAPTPYIYPSTRFAAPALLCASNQYGIVARSLPLSGKVLTGYLDASTGAARLGGGGGNPNFGWANMNGNGNPNAQFTPNITASDVTSSVPPSSSQGEVPSGYPMLGTAHVVWGTSGGEVIFTTAPRVMNANVNDGRGGRTGRAGAGTEVRRCRLGDEHEGAVRDVKWVFGGGETTHTQAQEQQQQQKEQAGRWAVSAGSDGRVKLWDAESAVCLWSSDVMRDRERVGGLPDPLGKVDAFFGFPSLRPNPNDSNNSNDSKATSGMILAVGESGDVYVWVGLSNPATLRDGDVFDTSNIRTIVVDCPFEPSTTFYLDSASASVNTGRNTQTQTRIQSAVKVSALVIDPNFVLVQEASGEGGRMRVNVNFLVAYEGDSLFYRVSVGLSVGVNDDDQADLDLVEVTPFGNPDFGATSVVKAYFGRRGFGFGFGFGERESSFVLVGDRVGCVGVYDWDTSRAGAAATGMTSTTATSTSMKRTTTTTGLIPPLKTFEAHRDGASVTALWWDGLVLVTGSARGTTHVWDGIKFGADGHLRSFVSPVKRARGGGGANAEENQRERERERQMVKHIVVNKERDVVVVVVGDTVMAWHAGVTRGGGGGRGAGAGGGKGGVRGRHAPGTGVGKKRVGGAKVIGEYEMRQTILESRDLLELELDNGTTMTMTGRMGRGYYERARAHAREREQREGLEVLGLSEGEAVEYALMLSRDEAVAAERARLEAEEGVFEGDFDDEGNEEEEGGSVYGVSPSVSSSSSSASLVSSVSASASNSSMSMSTSRSGGSMARSSPARRMGMPIVSSRHLDRDRVRVGPSASNEKVQISPPYQYRSEAKEAGEEYVDVDVDGFDGVGGGGGGDVGLELEESHFPPIPGSTGASPGRYEGVPRRRRRGDDDDVVAGEEEGDAKMGKGNGKGKGKGKAVKKGEKNKKNKNKKALSSSFSSGGVNANTNVNVNANSNSNTNSASSRVPVASVGAAAATTAAAGSSTPGGSPTSVKANAWSVPLKAKVSSSPSSSSSVVVPPPGGGMISSSRSGVSSGGPRAGAGGSSSRLGFKGEDTDEDLWFALELSLVEARSRGEDV